MKVISGKRVKTEADYEELARLEWYGSLYIGEAGGPIVPGDNVVACVVEAAKKSRQGKQATAGVFSLGHAVLEYDGPKDPDQMWDSGDFRFSKLVRVQRNRIVRTRVIFQEWAADVPLAYEDTLIRSESQLFDWLTVAGLIVGLLDWRPQYGRFSVERID